MSGRRGILLEIQGCLVGFSSSETTLALAGATWATSVVEAIRSIPNSQSMAVDPFSGDFQNGGTDLSLTKEAGILLVRSSSPSTELTANMSTTDLSVSVVDTSAFPATGTIWIDAEAVLYSGKTATTFAPLTRGALGTTTLAHTASVGTAAQPNKAYGFNPNILGRIATISWYDLDDSSPPWLTLKFYGTIDDFEFGANAFTLRLISNAKQFIDAEAMTKRFASSSFQGAFFKGQTTELQDLPARATNKSGGLNAIAVDLDDLDLPMPSPHGRNQVWTLQHYRMNDEVLAYGTETTPTGTVTSVGGYRGNSPRNGNYFAITGFFFVGDTITWTSGTTYVAQITKVDPAPVLSLKKLYVYHTNQTNPPLSATVTATGRQKLAPLFRARAGTIEGDHKIGTAVKEVRSLHGNQVVVLLRLMLSRNGDLVNSIYDALTVGWGAGIDESFVDVAAFEALIPETPTRTFFFEEPVSIRVLLSNLARVTGARIYVNTAGILTARHERELWVDSFPNAVIDIDLIEKDSVPVWHPQMNNIFNAWSFRGNARKGGDFRDEAHFEEPLSVARYGRRPLEDYEDRHMELIQDAVAFEILAFSVLQRWSTPNPIIDVVLLQTLGQEPLEPGMIVNLDIPHVPNMEGGAGLTGSAEVLEWTPRDSSMTADVRLALMPVSENVRLISPAAEVDSVDLPTKALTLLDASLTHLAPPLGRTGIENVMPRTGDQDIDYFEVGLTIQVVDRATPSNRHSTTIAAINYAGLTITLASLPGWTIGAGDIVRLDLYATTEAYSAEFTNTYLWMADNTTKLLGSVAAHVWGR